MAQNGQNDHFGQNDLIRTGFWYSQDQNGPKEVYFGPFRSANRALVTPDFTLIFEEPFDFAC